MVRHLRTMRRPFLFVLLALLPGALSAQRLFERKRPDIIPLDGKMRRTGFYFAPGVTYTLTRFNNEEETFGSEPDTVYNALYDPEGRFGLYLEAGWFLATRDPVILDYWDVGLAYKQLRGGEAGSGTLLVADTLGEWTSENAFNDQHLTLHVNANKFIQTTDRSFVQLSLGANADWRFGTGREQEGLQVPTRQDFPPELIGQFHVKVGYGFKATERLLVIPAIETPVFSVAPEDDGRFGALPWFSSEYRPLILSVRFLFLRYPKGFACPPAIKHNEFEGGKRKEYKPDSYHP